jgi:hypothetical protein
MWRRLVAMLVALALPAAASAGPLRESARTAGRDLALAQSPEEPRSRGRFWTAVGLIAGGGVMATLGGLEVGDDEDGPDDGEDLDDSDDGEDSDGWGNKALLGGGIAAAALGGVLLLTGGKSGPVVSVRPGRVAVRQTLRF